MTIVQNTTCFAVSVAYRANIATSKTHHVFSHAYPQMDFHQSTSEKKTPTLFVHGQRGRKTKNPMHHGRKQDLTIDLP